MKLYFQIAWRVLGRIVYFGWMGLFIMIMHGFIMGAIAGAAFTFILQLYAMIIDAKPLDNREMLRHVFALGFFNAGLGGIIGLLSFAIAGLISSLRESDAALGDVLAESGWGGVLGTITGAVLWPCAIQLLELAWVWKSLSPLPLDFHRSYNMGVIGGFCVGIFFGAIYGALEKPLPTHQILPTLRRWLKLSTHEK